MDLEQKKKQQDWHSFVKGKGSKKKVGPFVLLKIYCFESTHGFLPMFVKYISETMVQGGRMPSEYALSHCEGNHFG